MDVLNEEEAMFESPLVDPFVSSPVTVSVCVSVGQSSLGVVELWILFLTSMRPHAGRSHHQRHGGDAFLRGPGASARHHTEVQKATFQR